MAAADDCDDTAPEAWTGAAEVCGDGVDNDCDADPGPCAGPAEGLLSDAALIAGPVAGVGALLVADVDGDGVDDVVLGQADLGDGRLSSLPGPWAGAPTGEPTRLAIPDPAAPGGRGPARRRRGRSAVALA